MEALQRFAIPMPATGSATSVKVPGSDLDDVTLRHVGVVDGELYVWFVIDPAAVPERVPLHVLRDGDELVGSAGARYLGSAVLPDGAAHVFLG